MPRSQRAQTLSEYVILLGILTVVGLYISLRMVGRSNNNGAIQTMNNNATQTVVDDRD